MNKSLPVTILLLCLTFIGTAQDYDVYKLTSDLQTTLSNNAEDQHRIFILLDQQIDFISLKASFNQRNVSLEDRGKIVVQSLQQQAANSQSDLLDYLKNTDGVVEGTTRSFWISNAIFTEVNTETLKALTRRVDVLLIEAEKPVVALAYERMMGPFLQPEGTEPGLKAINAPAMWELGYTGYGLTALIMDTGTSPHHPALRNNYLGIYKPLDQVWTGTGDEPFDCDDHGTHVAGTVLGLDRLNNDTIGVAFNGLWTAAPPIGCGFQNTNLGVIETYEWSLNPDGDSNTSDDIPAVINNSWGFGQPSNGDECNSIFSSTFEALEAAGIANVFAAGNDGPNEQTLLAPQNININLVNCFTVAALQGNNPQLPAANFSSRGPSICGGEASLLIKPEVSAPGVSVRSAVANGYYGNLSGTSMASPHVAGAVLLLREAFPELTGEAILTALYFSCRDLGEPGEDNTFGMGVIDVKAAYDYLVDAGLTPTPGGVTNDVMVLKIESGQTTCSDNFVAEILIENGGTSALMDFEVFYQLEGIEIFSGTANWTGQLISGERSLFTFNATDIDPGDYELTVEVRQPNGVVDPRPLNNILRKQITVVDEAPLSPQSLTEGDICQGGAAVLVADMQHPGTIEWYDEPEAGTAIGTGSPWVTPALEESQTYWVDAKVNRSIGMTNANSAATFIPSSDKKMLFDVLVPFTLKSVKVNFPEEGFLIVRAERNNGNFAGSKIFENLSPGVQRLELDFDFQPDEQYRLFVRLAGPQPPMATPNAVYPYTIDGVVSITGNSEGNNNYYYFYDWEITYNHLCGRIPVTVPITNGEGPLASFSTSTDTILASAGPIIFTNTSTEGSSYSWDFGDGNSSTAINPEYMYFDPGTYIVVLTVMNADGCVSSTARTITVTESPTGVESDFILKNQVQVFPNPVHNRITVSFELEEPANIAMQLLNIQGQQVADWPVNQYQHSQIQYSVSHLSPGIYYLWLNHEKGQEVKKIVIIR